MTDPRATPFAPEPLTVALLNATKQATSYQAVRRGANEALKQINRGRAALVLIAADAEPLEIVLNIPLVCEDRGVPYVFIGSKEALGRACGVSVPTVVASLNKHDLLNSKLEELIGQIEALV